MAVIAGQRLMAADGSPAQGSTRLRSTCCFCGVGCGVLLDVEHADIEHADIGHGAAGSRISAIHGDPQHPANHGHLCSKGMALPETAGDPRGRLLQPELRPLRGAPRRAVDWALALDSSADRLADIIQRHGPDAVALYISGQLLTEDYYVFNKLAKGLLGSNNIDTNSRLCMSSAVSAYKLALGADGPPTCYEDLEHAQTVLLAGSNMAYAHPVLFRRLQAAKAANPAIRWIVVDPRTTDTAAMADLHLAIQPGTDVALFNGMLHHLIWEGLIDNSYIARHTEGFDQLKQLLRDYPPRVAAELCGVPLPDLVQAAEWFGRSPAALSLYCMGLNQSAHGTDKNLALIHLHLATAQIGRPGAGPFSLTGQPNAMGGREVGGMASMLAAHREIGNPDHRAEVEQYWGLAADSLSARPGLPAVAMFDALHEGRVKAIWIACTNPVHSMPDIPRVREALQRAELVIVQECFANSDTLPYADIVLPATTWGEKDGTVTNSERRISRVRAALPAPGQARADWWIANEVGKRLEARLPSRARHSLFDFADSAAIFAEHAGLTRGRDLDISGLDHARLETMGPQQWPFPADASIGQARRYGDGVFASDNGRARFQPTPYKPVAEPVSAHYPFRLLTGRLRDQWHGMSRTGRVPRLFSHSPQACVQMHPGDAERRNLQAGDLLRITSKRGELVLPLELSTQVGSGTLFAAMHWSGQYLSSGGINEVTQPAVDARSFQPELKHAAVKVEKAEFGWHLLAVRKGDVLAMQQAVQPLLRDCGFAALALHPSAAGDDSGSAWLVLQAAAAQPLPQTWMQQLESALALHANSDSLEYRDARRGLLRRVAWHPQTQVNRIEGLLVTGQRPARDSDSLLAHALAGQPWPGSRMTVFAAAQSVAPRERVVCSCMQVTESAIRQSIAHGAGVAELKQQLGCGTLCGSCVPELTRLCGNVIPA